MTSRKMRSACFFDRAVRRDWQAREALIRLWHAPDYHVLLKEIVGAV